MKAQKNQLISKGESLSFGLYPYVNYFWKSKTKQNKNSTIGIEINPISWIKWNAAWKEITYKKGKYI